MMSLMCSQHQSSAIAARQQEAVAAGSQLRCCRGHYNVMRRLFDERMT